MFVLILVLFVYDSICEPQSCNDYCTQLLSGQIGATWNFVCNCNSQNENKETNKTKRNIDNSAIYYEPLEYNSTSNELHNINQSFVILNPTSYNRNISNLKSEIHEKHKAGNDLINVSDNIVENQPFYLDIDIKESPEPGRSSQNYNDIDNLQLTERNLKDCIDLHMMIYFRRNGSNEIKKIVDEDNIKKYFHISDANLMMELNSKCHLPSKVLEQSLLQIEDILKSNEYPQFSGTDDYTTSHSIKVNSKDALISNDDNDDSSVSSSYEMSTKLPVIDFSRNTGKSKNPDTSLKHSYHNKLDWDSDFRKGIPEKILIRTANKNNSYYTTVTKQSELNQNLTMSLTTISGSTGKENQIAIHDSNNHNIKNKFKDISSNDTNSQYMSINNIKNRDPMPENLKFKETANLENISSNMKDFSIVTSTIIIPAEDEIDKIREIKLNYDIDTTTQNAIIEDKSTNVIYNNGNAMKYYNSGSSYTIKGLNSKQNSSLGQSLKNLPYRNINKSEKRFDLAFTTEADQTTIFFEDKSDLDISHSMLQLAVPLLESNKSIGFTYLNRTTAPENEIKLSKIVVTEYSNDTVVSIIDGIENLILIVATSLVNFVSLHYTSSRHEAYLSIVTIEEWNIKERSWRIFTI
nr:unnamed protein product [Amyelois transitella]